MYTAENMIQCISLFSKGIIYMLSSTDSLYGKYKLSRKHLKHSVAFLYRLICVSPPVPAPCRDILSEQTQMCQAPAVLLGAASPSSPLGPLRRSCLLHRTAAQAPPGPAPCHRAGDSVPGSPVPGATRDSSAVTQGTAWHTMHSGTLICAAQQPLPREGLRSQKYLANQELHEDSDVYRQNPPDPYEPNPQENEQQTSPCPRLHGNTRTGTAPRKTHQNTLPDHKQHSSLAFKSRFFKKNKQKPNKSLLCISEF